MQQGLYLWYLGSSANFLTAGSLLVVGNIGHGSKALQQIARAKNTFVASARYIGIEIPHL
jgi:hypothetical protein